jgi:prepilin-type N-terminal cleavage/methylation domain-containing protein
MKSVRTNTRRQTVAGDGGFTMIELLVSMAVILIVSGIIVGSTIDMTRLGQKMTNRCSRRSVRRVVCRCRGL